MPSRTIKESICVSENVNLLTADEERFFLRLTTKADDYGRYDGRAQVIRGAVFPLKEEIAAAMVEKWLQRLAAQEIDLIRFYMDRGVRYLYFINWEKHQGPPRAKQSKYPQPTVENTIPPVAGAGICGQMSADVPDLRSSDLDLRSPIFGSRSTSSAGADGANDKPAKAEYPPDFEQFWKAYPKHRRVAKKAAFDEWKKLGAVRPPVETLVKVLERQCQSKAWQEEGGKYVPYPERWLKKRRWEDDPEAGNAGTALQAAGSKDPDEILGQFFGQSREKVIDVESQVIDGD